MISALIPSWRVAPRVTVAAAAIRGDSGSGLWRWWKWRWRLRKQCLATLDSWSLRSSVSHPTCQDCCAHQTVAQQSWSFKHFCAQKAQTSLNFQHVTKFSMSSMLRRQNYPEISCRDAALIHPSSRKSGVARQTKPKKGPKRKVHEFRPFLWILVFFLRKTSTIHIELCSGMPLWKFMNWPFFGLVCRGHSWES